MLRSFVLTTEDADQWEAVLPVHLSVTGSLQYMRIWEKQTGHPARLFVVEAEGQIVAYPHFLRPVSALPFANNINTELWDTYTPEYSGPLCTGSSETDKARTHFNELLHRYCEETGIVAEFAHLNPWGEFRGIIKPESLELNREVVYVDLTLDEEQIWMKSLNSDCRRQTKQAQRAGVRIYHAKSAEDVFEFQRLHQHTMERRSALDQYYMNSSIFLAILRGDETQFSFRLGGT